MKASRLFTLCLVLAFLNPFLKAQENTGNPNKNIVVLGSSVASGWVTSYEEKYDFKNGWAYRLERYLKDRGYDVINKGIPGDNTKDAIERFDEDVLPENPDYLIVGLSMSNEGLETEDPDSVYLSFQTGIRKIIAKCESEDIYPVLGLCYANDNFTPQQYGYLKRMNIEMNTYGYPCINFLGAFDDGYGHLPGSFKFDPNHPDNRGHEEFFLSFIPDLFQAIDEGIKLPELIDHDSYIKLGKKENNQYLYFFPSENMHSFSFSFDFRMMKNGELAQIRTDNTTRLIEINGGKLFYMEEEISGHGSKLLKKWNRITISHQYLAQNTHIYLNEKLIASSRDQIEPAVFIIGSESSAGQFRNLMIHRAALNGDEIVALNDQLIHASLVCYAPLENGNLKNHAQTKSIVYLDPENGSYLLKRSIDKIHNAALHRANELKIEDKMPIEMDPEEYTKFAGTYEIAENDNFVIEVENDKIYFVDRGRRGEILPEAANKFFIKFPGEIDFTFEIAEDGSVKGMVANFNGQKIPAKRID